MMLIIDVSFNAAFGHAICTLSFLKLAACFIAGGELVLQQPRPSKQTVMTLLGAEGMTLDYTVHSDGGIHVHFPTNLPFAKLVGKGAWTIKMTNVT